MSKEKSKEAYDDFVAAAIGMLEAACNDLKQIGKANANPPIPTGGENVPNGIAQRTFAPFEQRMLEELQQLDERTKKLGLFMDEQKHPNKERAKITYLEARAMERQYEAMKAYQSALHERCALRELV